MRSVFKYLLPVEGRQFVTMPEGAKLLHLGVQFERPCVWALVDTDAPAVDRAIATHGTGHALDPAEDGSTYVGSYMLQGGGFVAHVFDMGEFPAGTKELAFGSSG